jgi:hypothetical protein
MPAGLNFSLAAVVLNRDRQEPAPEDYQMRLMAQVTGGQALVASAPKVTRATLRR